MGVQRVARALIAEVISPIAVAARAGAAFGKVIAAAVRTVAAAVSTILRTLLFMILFLLEVESRAGHAPGGGRAGTMRPYLSTGRPIPPLHEWRMNAASGSTTCAILRNLGGARTCPIFPAGAGRLAIRSAAAPLKVSYRTSRAVVRAWSKSLTRHRRVASRRCRCTAGRGRGYVRWA
jgi:hypothetical protein